MASTTVTCCIALVLIVAATMGEATPVAEIDIGAQYEARVRSGIEQNRKSGAIVRVLNADGRPIVGARVKIEQKTHDFLFGCAFPMWKAPPKRLGDEGWKNWNRCFTRIFNYATPENSLKWGPMETVKGEVDYASADFIAAWCGQQGVKLKGHTLIWAHPKNGYPEWVEQCSAGEIESLAKDRVHTVAARYKGRVDVWDVVNEPIHNRWFEQHWDPEYVVKSYKWAREANPDAKLVINEYGGFRGEVDRFVPYVEDLIKKGAPIDAIGEQAHDPPLWYSPKQVFGTLDKMASLGLPIHITEFTYPSNDSEIKGGFVEGKWDEGKQGEFYRYFVTLCFSHPKVEAITLWAMWDGSSWIKQGGIVRKNWTPKPAYEALDDLINKQWHTELNARSDTKGEVRFRGFHGEYAVTVTAPGGKSKSARLHLEKGSVNRIDVRLD